MFRSRLFWKLFLGFTAVNLLSLFALLLATWRWQEERSYELAEQRLTTAAGIGIDMVQEWTGDADPGNALSLAQQIADRGGVELALFDATGSPILKTRGLLSYAQLAGLAQSAQERGEAWLGTRNGTLSPGDNAPGINAYALRVSDEAGAPLGVVCATQLSAPILGEISSLWWLYALWGLVAALLVIGVGYGVVAHLVGPVRALNDAANAMAGGDYGQRAFVPNNDELGTLATAFNGMSLALGEQLTALQESDRRQATVLGGMTEGVVAVDTTQRVLFANAAAGKLFDFLPPEVVGRPLLEVIRNHALHEAATAVVSAHRSQRLEIEWEERTLSVQATPLVGDPAAGAVIVLHDVSELRRLETLRRDFVANVSHELKTPLSSIKAYTETLLNRAAKDDENRPRFLTQIAEQANRLDDLIRDMLNLARIESAQQPFAIQTVNVAEFVEASIRDYTTRANAKEILLTSDVEKENDSSQALGLQVKADPEGLRVILGNLLDNAIKYTPAGGEVQVHWAAEGAMVRIDVADTGIGIPGDKAARVFERFYRADAARNREQGGTGLGLSIVKHWTQSFGGEVSVRSEENRGTTFTVTLPAA